MLPIQVTFHETRNFHGGEDSSHVLLGYGPV